MNTIAQTKPTIGQKRIELMAAMRAVIESAPAELKNKLAQCIEDYSEINPRVFADMTDGRKGVFISDLWEVLIDETEAMPHGNTDI
jgi:hypothetical protein